MFLACVIFEILRTNRLYSYLGKDWESLVLRTVLDYVKPLRSNLRAPH